MVVENWFKFHGPRRTDIRELAILLELSESDLKEINKAILHEPNPKAKSEITINILERLNFFGDHDPTANDILK